MKKVITRLLHISTPSSYDDWVYDLEMPDKESEARNKFTQMMWDIEFEAEIEVDTDTGEIKVLKMDRKV